MRSNRFEHGQQISLVVNGLLRAVVPGLVARTLTMSETLLYLLELAKQQVDVIFQGMREFLRIGHDQLRLNELAAP